MSNEAYASIWLTFAVLGLLARVITKEDTLAWVRFSIIMAAIMGLYK